MAVLLLCLYSVCEQINRLFVKCGGYSYKKLLALAIQIASAILLA